MIRQGCDMDIRKSFIFHYMQCTFESQNVKREAENLEAVNITVFTGYEEHP